MGARSVSVFAVITGLLTFSSLSFAHHGTNASYDTDKQVTLNGVVTEFVWSNPHCQIYLDVKDDKGNVVHWGAETNSPGQLRTGGWSRETLKPGDHVTVTLSPSRAGTPAGVLLKVVLPDGTVLARGAGAAQ